jgi:SM-20-related protein
MELVNMAKLRAASLQREPFEHVIVHEFLSAEVVQSVNATFPPITKGGSFPIESLAPGMAIKDIIDALDSAEFEAAIAEKFDAELAGKSKMYSLRGYLRAKDGKIHTDSKDKIITVLLYLNERWEPESGQLRLLRNGTDLESYVAEIAPEKGNLLVFKRGESSWHGHHPFEGQRRALQMNWMTSEGSRGFHAFRHKVSAAVKKLTAA